MTMTIIIIIIIIIANILNNMLLRNTIQKIKILLNIPEIKRMKWLITLYDCVESYLFYII
jgi:hypothetical protein